jgi:hypothetical protein
MILEVKYRSPGTKDFSKLQAREAGSPMLPCYVRIYSPKSNTPFIFFEDRAAMPRAAGFELAKRPPKALAQFYVWR